MATPAKALVPAKLLENAQTTQYTAVLCTAKIDKATATNTSAVNVTMSVNLVEDGGSSGAGNLVMKTQVITPGECYPCPELVGHTLEPGGMISTLASAVASIVFMVSGRELT